MAAARNMRGPNFGGSGPGNKTPAHPVQPFENLSRLDSIFWVISAQVSNGYFTLGEGPLE